MLRIWMDCPAVLSPQGAGARISQNQRDAPFDCLWHPTRLCFMAPEPVSPSASPFYSRTDRVRTSYR